MTDFKDLITQAKKMQEKMKETQEALKKIEVEGISGGNTVRVIMNGEGELKKVIFDEATSSLDTKSEIYIKQSIENTCKNKTVILIAHRLSTVVDADHIYVLDKGNIVEHGNHSELIEKKGHYASLYNIQDHT